MISKRILVAAIVAAASIGTAQAATDTSNFNVTITITESCDIHTTAPTNINFGSVLRSGTPSPAIAQGTLTVKCSTGTPYNIGLNGGSNFDTATGGSATAPVANGRRMANGSNYVPYDLYSNAAATTFWGNTVGTNTVIGTPGTGSNQLYTVYAQLRGTTPTNVPAGTYSDTVTATVTY